MKTLSKLKSIVILSVVTLVVSCNKKSNETQPETMLSGNVTILTDESIFPIVEDQALVFEHNYSAKINLLAKAEAEAINEFFNDTARVAVLTRLLTPEEEQNFASRRVTPRLTRFGIDAIAFITNIKNNDSILDLEQVYLQLRNEKNTIKPIVFDNNNSSISRLIHEKAEIKVGDNKSIYSKNNSQELIKFIAENPNYIGIIGINWLTQTPKHLEEYKKEIKILKISDDTTNKSEKKYIFPTQANIGKKTYPLTRELFLLNYQGTKGLGMGFASFVVSNIGQKIMLTSGLAPMEVQPLEVNVKK